MRITVTIDDDLLDDLVKITGESKKSPAVAKAVREYIYRQKARDFGEMLLSGEFHYDVLNEELEAAQDSSPTP